ncbi:hypothetical protein GCM10027265_37410 [Jatrophihabitans fulvus]
MAAREADPEPSVRAGTWLRAIRRHRRLSQRELVELSGLRRSTVERIEAGTTVPRFDTVLRLLDATGCGLALIDHRGRPLVLDVEHEQLRDGAGRRFPAHLPSGPTPSEYEGGWWGWRTIAWDPLDRDWVPRNTFWRRNAPAARLDARWSGEGERGLVWDDAT